MSHEFMITTAAPDSKADPFEQLEVMRAQPHGHFQGNWGGAIYSAFNAEKFDAGTSGCFDGKTISKAEAITALDVAFELLENYPDPNRTNDLKVFYKKTLVPASDTDVFYVHFF
jgi:hypothetical protein